MTSYNFHIKRGFRGESAGFERRKCGVSGAKALSDYGVPRAKDRQHPSTTGFKRRKGLKLTPIGLNFHTERGSKGERRGLKGESNCSNELTRGLKGESTPEPLILKEETSFPFSISSHIFPREMQLGVNLVTGSADACEILCSYVAPDFLNEYISVA
jgi:hypothetical protein